MVLPRQALRERVPVSHLLQALAEGVHRDVRGVPALLVDPDLHGAEALDEPAVRARKRSEVPVDMRGWQW